MEIPVLELEGVTKIFTRGYFNKKYIVALEGINLKINKQDRWAIIGESGMGKTTLARIASLLETPTKGKIKWFGRDLSNISKKELSYLRTKVQYVHQDPYASLHPSRNIYSTLADPLKKNNNIRGKQIDNKVEELLNLVGLTPPSYFLNKYPHHLSGGGRQRLAIARALTANPEILIADEPISMIDMSLRATIIQLLKILNKELGLSIILILHDIGAARFFATNGGKLVILYGGRIVEKGECEEVINNPLHPYTRTLISATPISDPDLAKEKKIPELRSYEPPKRELGKNSCPFSHACLYSQDICLREDPVLENVNEKHEVACFFWKDLPKWIPPWIKE
ncbi:MAG: dipeptide/oligopeptide/nickel ABC transporter ATP-binding protein [Dictyoglomus sp. NZ13-RE01]|nr:MAG: dipeptide/oligopeptide/nickel ABC transporter ATP-binding protein [Dictyoglomus sp. NZ13-RE01]